MQLAAPHFEQKPFMDGLMDDFYHTTVPYSEPPDEAL
jgi:hypothetical protein